MQYTSFKVTTHSTNPKYKCCNASNAVVMRRYSEFHMLFRKLRTDYPGTVVPPCPEKNQMQKLRKAPEFIEARRQALEVFVNKLCCHRTLRHSDLLRNFLEADEPSWTMEMHRMKQSEEQGTMLGTMTQLASDLMHSTKNLTKGQSDDKGEEPEYLQARPSSALLCTGAHIWSSTQHSTLTGLTPAQLWSHGRRQAWLAGKRVCLCERRRSSSASFRTSTCRAVQGVQHAPRAPPQGRVQPLGGLCG